MLAERLVEQGRHVTGSDRGAVEFAAGGLHGNVNLFALSNCFFHTFITNKRKHQHSFGARHGYRIPALVICCHSLIGAFNFYHGAFLDISQIVFYGTSYYQRLCIH